MQSHVLETVGWCIAASVGVRQTAIAAICSTASEDDDLPLNARGGNTSDEGFLGQEEDQDNRQHHQYGGGHE